MEDNKIEEVSWNLSNWLITEIALLLQRASKNYLLGRINEAFFNLKAIKMRIIQNTDKKERESFKELEYKIAKLGFETPDQFIEKLGTSTSAQKESALKEIKKKNIDKLNLYENYNELLMDTLKKYGYTIPAKKDETIMSA